MGYDGDDAQEIIFRGVNQSDSLGLCVGTPESIHSIQKFLLCQFTRCFMYNQTKVSLAQYIGNIEIKRGLSAVGTVYR